MQLQLRCEAAQYHNQILLFFLQGDGGNMQVLHEKDAMHVKNGAEQVVPGAGGGGEESGASRVVH
jgi:hypothetical protein